ncbi:MAG: molybdopterin biosynthesis protein [Thermoguttaceae bacterium]|nr:molybdopterin biosynthesis protein [Thermoguttaceae bacterium]MDW8077903.1 molybdopterin biosynthesis protein [Thermoguttaceae bacterium]
MSDQPPIQEFLTVLPPEEAWRKFIDAVNPRPLGEEQIPLADLLGRVLAQPIVAATDLPPFDRSIVDGFAVRAEDTYGATQLNPRKLALLPGRIEPGHAPTTEVDSGQAIAIATGAMLPRGADAVAMVEDCLVDENELVITRALVPGAGVAYAGTDVARGETVLWPGEIIGPADIAVLAALGMDSAIVYKRPRVAIFSTGNELLPSGRPLQPGKIYDANGPMLAAAVTQLGCQPISFGIIEDELERLSEALRRALEQCDAVLLSGGTSKGGGDLSYQAVRAICRPGIIVHGIAAKPGKPLCLAVHEGKPVVILPGFPLSAVFTFNEFVAPLLCQLSGRRAPELARQPARVAVAIHSEPGRREYVPVQVFPSAQGPLAWPVGKGSGSVSAFKQADGYLVVDTLEEIVPAGTERLVYWFGRHPAIPDLTIIGSHCVGVDLLVGKLGERGFRVKFLAAGSMAGLTAVKRGQCDLAGIHLFDEQSGQYNRPFLSEGLELIPGYRRMQGIVFRAEDPRFRALQLPEILRRIREDPFCRMVNRNPGSGTRILIDRLLQGARPPGYSVTVNTHHAVVAAVAQGRADWGVAIEWVARLNGLGFLPLAEEHFDFVVALSRRDRPAVVAFRELLADPGVRAELGRFGFRLADEARAT